MKDVLRNFLLSVSFREYGIHWKKLIYMYMFFKSYLRFMCMCILINVYISSISWNKKHIFLYYNLCIYKTYKNKIFFSSKEYIYFTKTWIYDLKKKHFKPQSNVLNIILLYHVSNVWVFDLFPKNFENFISPYQFAKFPSLYKAVFSILKCWY